LGREVPQKEEITKRLKELIATGFYIGYLPIAPATFSCFISVVIWYFLIPLKAVYVVFAVVLFIVGTTVSNDLAKEWGKDPRRIVVDEYASLLLPLFFTPVRILPLVATFLLFRIFDIVKPPPVRNAERMSGGWGIMMDDLLAAVYTTIIIFVLRALNLLY
jgi:phosphatidylglycerophosphatase A